MEARGVWAAEGLGMSSDCSFVVSVRRWCIRNSNPTSCNSFPRSFGFNVQVLLSTCYI